MNSPPLVSEEQPISRLLLLFTLLLLGFFGIALYGGGKISGSAYLTNKAMDPGFTMDRSFSSGETQIREIFTRSPQMNIRLVPLTSSKKQRSAEATHTSTESHTPSVDEVLRSIRAYRIAGQSSEIIPVIALKYLSAHFDSRRARQKGTFAWSDEMGSYEFIHLQGKNSRALALGINKAPEKTVLILVSNSEEKIPEPALKSALHVAFTGGFVSDNSPS